MVVVEEDEEENKEELLEVAPDLAAEVPCSSREEQDLAPEAKDHEEDLLELDVEELEDEEEQFVAPGPGPGQLGGT